MMFTQEASRKLLNEANVFFGPDEDQPELAQELNMNDVWGWACADGQAVLDKELPEVAELFWLYGWCGIIYWVSQKNGNMVSEFHHYNRMIEFVRAEEDIKIETPDSTKRAYTEYIYTIGEKDEK